MVRRFSAMVIASFMMVGAVIACSDTGVTPPETEPDPFKKPDAGRLDAGQMMTATATATSTTMVMDPNFAEPPELIELKPNTGTVGALGPTIIVTGSNFVPRTIVQLDGAELGTTSYVSPTELRATIPTEKLKVAGKLNITVGTSPPGGGASKTLTFDVVFPKPVLTGISDPNSALIGSGATKIIANGRDFVSTSVVAFDGTDIQTLFRSDKALEATIPASKLMTAGTFDVLVKTPAPGGGTSSPISFTVTNPTVQLTAISPQQADVGSSATQVTLTGAGFLAGRSSVTFNGTTLSNPQIVSATQIKVSVPAALLTTTGDYPIVVKNPAPGGGVSAPMIFQVRYPAPVLTTVTPSELLAGSAATELVLAGSRFVPTSEVFLNGNPVALTANSATQLKVIAPASLLGAAGSVSVRVQNPAPGGGQSAALNVVIKNPLPQITSLTTATPVFFGSPDTMLTVNGTGFNAASILRVNGSQLLANLVGATQMTAMLPSSVFTQLGNVLVSVMNPAPGGGTSNVAMLAVGCDTTGVEVQLSQLASQVTLNTNFLMVGAPTQPVFASAGSCGAGILSVNERPFRAVVVQNLRSSRATLEAWAVCTATESSPGTIIREDDAFLSFYRRGTVPTNPLDREVCTPLVSEGFLGTGAYTSPEANKSEYCPGLTKANGQGIELNVCEKAVVFMQPYSIISTTFTAPPTMKVGLR
jgi:hypothetical protein